METRELGAAFSTLYHHWWQRAKPGYYSYQASLGRRRAVLHSAQESYLPRLESLEAEIPLWVSAHKVRGPEEKKMWERAARVRKAITNADPDNVRVLLPV